MPPTQVSETPDLTLLLTEHTPVRVTETNGLPEGETSPSIVSVTLYFITLGFHRKCSECDSSALSV